jgi:mycothiol system anti-sigma-R factor
VISCREAVARLWAYLDRNLDRLEEQELEGHLGLCRHCCGELEFARHLRALLRRSGAAAALPGETRARLEALIRELGGQR